MTDHMDKKISIGIIGSGAIVEESYLPAAKNIPNVAVSHIVDLNFERAKDVASRFKIPHYLKDYRELFRDVDAVVVATPPGSHSKITIDCLNFGLPVLCEKPLAASVQEAELMVEASEQNKVILAVGMVRRLNWSAETLKKLVQNGFIGKITSFDVEEGWEFSWPLRTAHIFKSKNSGVIADTGSHLVDLLLWVLNAQDAKVIDCRDDNWGGIESNAVINMDVNTQSRIANGRIELSFTRTLRNTIKIAGERGSLETETVGGKEIIFTMNDKDNEVLKITPSKPYQRIKNQEFTIQLNNFTRAIKNGEQNYVRAEEVLMTMQTIEECYRIRQSAAQTWDKKHLEEFFERS